MADEAIDVSNEEERGAVWRGGLASVAALVIAFLLIALVALVAASNRDRDAAQVRERHSYDVMLVVRALDTSMARAEAVLGRYVISGDKQVGALYYDEWRRAGRQLRQLTKLAADNPEQARLVVELGRLYEQRGVELAAPARRTNFKQNMTALTLYYRAGKAESLDAIDALITRISDNERALLNLRANKAAASAARSNFLAALLSAAGVLLVIGAAALGWTAVQAIAQRHRARRDADSETERAWALETAVATRTRELSEANERLREEGRDRAAAEAKLRQVQKMEAVGQLTGGIAHDFNNMLAVVVGGLELARRRLTYAPPEVRRHIDNAMEGAERAAALTRRLLTFARAEPLLPAGVDPRAMITGMADLLDRTLGERIRIETRIAGDPWHVWCDPNSLENAILNLAVNARDAMGDEGLLQIEVTNIALTDRASEGGEAPPGDYVRICVADRGCGMAPHVIERAFEPFFTTKPVGKGTGLGLSQIFGFVRQSGGEVTLESEPGAGTTVSLYLPRHHEQAVPAAAPALTSVAAIPEPAAGMPVLVVEDDPRVLAATTGALEEIGYAPVACAGGAEALAILRQRHDFVLIVTDVQMPEMTGPQLIAAARPLAPDAGVLYVTGYTGEAGDATLFAGNAVLRKPFTIAGLERAVTQAMVGVRPSEAA